MTTIPKIASTDSEFTCNGMLVKMVYSYTDEGDEGGERIDGEATIGDTVIEVGGGWVENDGVISKYSADEIGFLDELITAVGLNVDDDNDREVVLADLDRACPSKWPAKDFETLAKHIDEFRTLEIVRIDDDLFSVQHLVSTNPRENGRSVAESISETEAKRLMLEMGIGPEKISREFH